MLVLLRLPLRYYQRRREGTAQAIVLALCCRHREPLEGMFVVLICMRMCMLLVMWVGYCHAALCFSARRYAYAYVRVHEHKGVSSLLALRLHAVIYAKHC